MIFSVAFDMGYFLLVFSIMVLAFANSNFIIARNGVPRFTGENFWYSIIDSYKTAIGDFSTDDYESNRDETLVWIIWLMNTFLIFIVLLNMIIAIISDTFEKVHESKNNNLLKELSILMVESELLVLHKNHFKNKKYMIIIEKIKDSNHVDHESKLRTIRLNMIKKVKEQKELLDSLYDELKKFSESELEKSLKEDELAINKEYENISRRLKINI